MTGGSKGRWSKRTTRVLLTHRRKVRKAVRTLTSLSLSNSLHAPHLPLDLVAEILCRLPVKHLLQLRCVCMYWNSLISQDSNFAKKHLRLSTSNHERHHLIRIPCRPQKEFLLCNSPISSIFSSVLTTTRVKQFSYSIRDSLLERAYGGFGASSCDGMVCFKIHNSLAVLCNPSIRKFKRLPPLKLPYQEYTSYTLAYDRFTNNYKIISLNSAGTRTEVNVHIVGTDYWRPIQDFPTSLFGTLPGRFVSDSVHWLINAAERYIVSLDLEKESYQKLSLPLLDDIITYITLGTLRGCLSLLCDRRDEFFDVWIMKEYCNQKSWTKLLTVPPVGESDFDLHTKALYISKDDQVLMGFPRKGKSNVMVYDSINNTFKTPKFNNNKCGKMVAQEVYVESLISPL